MKLLLDVHEVNVKLAHLTYVFKQVAEVSGDTDRIRRIYEQLEVASSIMVDVGEYLKELDK